MEILVTGATGVVGSEVCELLRSRGQEMTRVSRTPAAGTVSWRMGAEPPPVELCRGWDAIIHLAASTRWTMTRDEAHSANIATTEAALSLAGPDTTVVHVSTAYAGDRSATGGTYDGYRNGYEWSKARCEDLVLNRAAGLTRVVRPPLVLGRRTDGRIARFSGPYTLLQTLVSGLAAVIVGEPDGYAEIAPVDQVAEVIVDASLHPSNVAQIEVIAAGVQCLRLDDLVSIILDTINQWRAGEGLAAIERPPMLSLDRWHRFYLPLASEYLSPMQNEVVRLLATFESYTSMSAPFKPTRQVADPAAVVRKSVEHWIARKPRLARGTPSPWTLVG